MNVFLDAIDLSANIQRGLSACRQITGLPALVLAAALTFICIGLAPLIWFFDISSTMTATDRAVAALLPTLPIVLVPYIALVTLALTLLPTVTELFGPRFAQAGIRVASGLIYFFSAFDAITDWPRVRDFMELYRGDFAGLGLFATPVFWLVRSLGLFMASFGFEVLFCIFAVCALALYVNSRPGATVSPRAVRYD